MLFQVVVKFGTAQCCICLPNILLTPLAPIYGKIGWFLNKCILKHSSLLVSGYWVYGWSSYVGLIGSHPPRWMCLGLALCWPELILEEWELHGGHNSLHWGRVPRPITTFWRNWAIKHQSQTHLQCQIVVQHGHCMQIWWRSPTKNLKGAKLENWLLTPTVVIEEYTPKFWRFVNSVYAFRLSIRRAIQKCILCWGSVGKVRLQKQLKRHRQYSPPVAWLALRLITGIVPTFCENADLLRTSM